MNEAKGSNGITTVDKIPFQNFISTVFDVKHEFIVSNDFKQKYKEVYSKEKYNYKITFEIQGGYKSKDVFAVFISIEGIKDRILTYSKISLKANDQHSHDYSRGLFFFHFLVQRTFSPCQKFLEIFDSMIFNFFTI